ncbi:MULTISPECIES: type VI secretion system contractile sheath small subunit [unclassified Saccharicrinis]|uniref:type VI secretion system contractile sheath small subunit n=1 Tax=unclassified Saccharicrinis TaxID=2646859 RepID=UPI003D32EF81
MQEYGIGGTEVKGDASEAIGEIPQNRTLMIEKLTDEEPMKPEMTRGLTSISDVFNHFSPTVELEFEDAEGATKEESLSFKSLADFDIKGITAQSEFLKDLTNQKEQFFKIIKQLKSNKMLRKALENPETKQAVLNAIYAMIKEIEEA